MKFTEFVEIAQKISPEFSATEVRIILQTYIHEIMMEMDTSFTEQASLKADGKRVDIPYEEFAQDGFPIGDRFIRMVSVSMADEQVHPVGKSLNGDVVYLAGGQALTIGIRSGDYVNPLPKGKQIDMLFAAAAEEICIDQDSVPPLARFHPALVMRLKSDLYAEVRMWDKVGYYNRRYQDMYRKLKNNLNRGHGEYNAGVPTGLT